MLRLAARSELGLATGLYCSQPVCYCSASLGNVPRAEALSSPRAEVAAMARRVAGLASRRAEAVAKLPEPAETAWRRERACSPVLAVMLRARSAELLMGLTAELLTATAVEHFPEHLCELAAARLRLKRAADFASGS